MISASSIQFQDSQFRSPELPGATLKTAKLSLCSSVWVENGFLGHPVSKNETKVHLRKLLRDLVYGEAITKAHQMKRDTVRTIALAGEDYKAVAKAFDELIGMLDFQPKEQAVGLLLTGQPRLKKRGVNFKIC